MNRPITAEARFDSDIRAKVFSVRDPLSPVEWAREHLSLAPGLNAMPGPFEPWPFQVEPLNAITEPGISSMTLCWASQVLGKSQLLAILVGWTISENPCGITMVHPTLDSAQHWSRTKLGPMLRDTEVLRARVFPTTGRKQQESSGANTVMLKLFLNGFLVMVGSNSPAGLAAHTARIVIGEEVDRFDAGGAEGDPWSIVCRRSETFPNAFKVLVSTPTVKGASRIEAELEETDYRQWHISCLSCAKPFVLEWSHIKWDKTSAGHHLPRTAMVECPHCNTRLSDAEREVMVRNGKWIPSRPQAEAQKRGYWLNAFASLLPSHQSYEHRLHQWAVEWLSAKSKGIQTIKTFVNTVFCRGWEEENTAVERPEIIWARREAYSCDEADPSKIVLHERVRLLTAGCDVQTDRIEVEVVAWATNLESWSIDFRILRGNLNQQTVWAELGSYLGTRFHHPWGFTCPIDGVGIDSGGHYTRMVYQFVGTRPLPNTFALKGKGAVGQKWLERSEKVRGLYVVAVDLIKRTIYDQLALTAPGSGYIHIPAARDYLWVEQLTAEKCVLRRVNGILCPRFELPPHLHNEALDCRVYARCVVEILRPNWDKIEAFYCEQREAASKEQEPELKSVVTVERLMPEATSQAQGPNINPSSGPSNAPQSLRRHDGTHFMQRPRSGKYG
jgi:phage terminase large subunit GpA-like protein